MFSLRERKILHEWLPDADQLLKGTPRISKVVNQSNWSTWGFRTIHPFLMPNGDLIIKDHETPLFRIDACARPVWKQDKMLFHHSIEADGSGGFWIPAVLEPQIIDRLAPDFFEDALTHVSAEGKILWQKSLTQILLDHGMEHAIFPASGYLRDPTHLNDIQPVLTDGPYWKAGDLFLSLRNLSMIMLYLPATDEIVWMKQGPWLAQHDVDILDDTRIGVFDNQAYDKGLGGRVKRSSRITVYDFASGDVSTPWAETMQRLEVKMLYEGLYTITPSGYLFVEETPGRIIFIAPDGAVVTQYATRALEISPTGGAGAAT